MCIRDRYGAAEFYNKAKKAGIKPIIGMEAYIVVDGSRFDRAKVEEANNKKKSKHYNHLIPVSYTHLTLPTSDLV